MSYRRLRRLSGPRRLTLEALEQRCFLAATPVISEFAAINDGHLRDGDGDSSDWIEIHNPSDAPVDLANWFLTDDPDNLARWQFPSTPIAADGYLVVFASGKDRRAAGAELHTSFKLDGDQGFLALVAPDGLTIESQSYRYDAQHTDVSYGLDSSETVSPLVQLGSVATVLIPNAAVDAAIGGTWTGASEPFDDGPTAGWIVGPTGIGYDTASPVATGGIAGTPAYAIPLGTPGNQGYAGPLGMDFVVNRPITLTSLGAFDDGSNGMGRTITVELWSRNDRGTPGNFADDTGTAILTSATFTTASPGTLVGGSRFKSLATPLTLQPGAYTIVARGYGSLERNAAAAAGAAIGSTAATTAIGFVGASRFGLAGSVAFPANVDLGPANRYGAGSFTFVDPTAPPAGPPNIIPETVAYGTLPGLGGETNDSNLGMDFDVTRPIRVTELGVFDSGQDGIAGAVAVSLWQRVGTVTTRLAAKTFYGQDGRLEPGAGSRFLPLDEPIILAPGSYSINASGFSGSDPFSATDDVDPKIGAPDSGGGALVFTGSSRYSSDPNRFTDEPHHRLANLIDTGPANKYAAGTFKFDSPVDALDGIDLETQARNVNPSAYVRIPFYVDPAAAAAYDGLRLKMRYDDGFVAYLNGNEFARRNTPAAILWNSAALAARAADAAFAPETIDVSDYLPLLQPGTNILAIQVLNASASDGDLLLVPELEAFTIGAPAERYFATPTPGVANGAGVLGIVADTSFSVDRGIVEAADLDAAGLLHVEIVTATPDAAIYYTTDGTQPTPDHGRPYTGPIDVGHTTTLRAAAYKPGYLPSDVDTQTYLFLDDVLLQAGVPERYPPTWNGVAADYDMDQNPIDQAAIVGESDPTYDRYREVIVESLRSLPTMSIVLDPQDIFGPTDGLYSNPFGRGEDWERPASVEYILPDGTPGFQIDAGLRMMGWTSRIPDVTPKHSLRLAFRDEYGAGRLNYPLFPDSPVESFNTLTLRSNSRDSWVTDYRDLSNPFRDQGPLATYIRDQWSKEAQRDMGQPYTAGNFVHLYINGLYWGLYNPTERPDAAYAADHFGGEDADYDVIRFCNPAPQVVDGEMTKWNELVAAAAAGLSANDAYQRIQGNNPDGTRNPAFEKLVDIDNLIDYMIAGQIHAADDWPCNYYAVRDRRPNSDGFKFITWDNDLAFPFGNVNFDKTDFESYMNGTPARFDQALRQNPEYRLRYADHVQKYLFNDGALTAQANIDRWNRIAATVAPALAAESARWGDYRRDIAPVLDRVLYTPTDHWTAFNDFMVNAYLPARTDIVLDQLRNVQLYPPVDAPTFSQHGGEVTTGFDLGMSAPAGTIYYTLDGSDPRTSPTDPVVATTLVAESAAKRVLIPTLANGGNLLADQWLGASEPFNDSTWTAGTGGVGYDRETTYVPLIGVNVAAAMDNVVTSAYIRIPFTVDPADVDKINVLSLNVRYDDGFAAYLNGTRVTGFNAPSEPVAWDAPATGANADTSAVILQTFDVSSFTYLLRPGNNVLAIRGLNQSLQSSDFLLSAELVARSGGTGGISPAASEFTGPVELLSSGTVKARVLNGNTWSAMTEALFAVVPPLRVTELMYNPPGADDGTEFVELTNVGTTPLDLTGVTFVRDALDRGIEYEFLATDANLTLGPGERRVIARDRAAFAAAYPNVSASVVADREFAGNLDNGGEPLLLVDAAGATIQEFTYDDAWYPDTDGDGHSLVIVDASGDRALWNDVGGWRSSFESGGSPGQDDLMPGDVNGDLAVGAADLAILRANLGRGDVVSRQDGDLTGDGKVSRADLATFVSHLGARYQPYVAPSAVPPATIVHRTTSPFVEGLLHGANQPTFVPSANLPPRFDATDFVAFGDAPRIVAYPTAIAPSSIAASAIVLSADATLFATPPNGSIAVRSEFGSPVATTTDPSSATSFALTSAADSNAGASDAGPSAVVATGATGESANTSGAYWRIHRGHDAATDDPIVVDPAAIDRIFSDEFNFTPFGDGQ